MTVLTRRKALEMAGISVASLTLGTIGAGCQQVALTQSKSSPVATQSPPPQPPIARLAPLVYPEKQWYEMELNNFIEQMPDEQLVALQIAAQNLPKDATVANLYPTRSEDVYKFLFQLSYVSSAAFGWDFGDRVWKIDYHKRVDWLRQQLSISLDDSQNVPTFQLERAIYARAHAQMWDKTPGDQRLLLLHQIESYLEGEAIEEKARISSMSGTDAQQALSRFGYLLDYRFYELMRLTLCFVATYFNIKLPAIIVELPAYIAELDMLAQPVGEAIAIVLDFLQIYQWGASRFHASIGQTLPIVCQIHATKVLALKAAGSEFPRLTA